MSDPELFPPIGEYFTKAPLLRIILLGCATFLYLCSFILFLIHFSAHFRAGRRETKLTLFFPHIRRQILSQILWVQVILFFDYLSLLIPRMMVIFKFISSTYQAWALYGFISLLTEYVGGKEGVILDAMRKQKVKIYAVFPFGCCFSPFMKKTRMTPRRLTVARFGVLQACFIKPLASFCALFLQFNGWLTPGTFSLGNGYLYITSVVVLSTLISMYFVFVIHRSLGTSIEGLNIQKKFLLVKILVPLFAIQTLLIGLIFKVKQIGERQTIFPSVFAFDLYESLLVLIEGIPLTVLCYKAYPVHGEIMIREEKEEKETASIGVQVDSRDLFSQENSFEKD